MVYYFCHRCGYEASQRINLKHHLNRKNICKPLLADISIEDIQNHYGFLDNSNSSKLLQIAPKLLHIAPKINAPNCSKIAPKLLQIAPNCSKLLQNDDNKHACLYCQKAFTRNSNLTKHLKICKMKKEYETTTLDNKDKEIEEKDKKIKELERKIKNEKTTNIINNTTNLTNTTNNIININNYGEENITHLKTQDFGSLLEGIYAAVPKLIKQIHFDPQHPENHNIKYPNKKFPYLKVIKDSKWELVEKKPELLDLIDSKYFMLKDKYYKILEKNKYILSDYQKKQINEFIDKYQDEDKEMIIDLLNKTELVLLNNS